MNHLRRALVWSLCFGSPCGLLVIAATPRAAAEELGLRAPQGFAVTLLAGDDMAHDIFSMTIDSHGEVVVSGPGYVKTLHDRDGDGHAESATLFSSSPKSGAQGMMFDGDDLVLVGDDAVMRLVDSDHDGRADGEPEIWARLKMSEHGAHGIVKGPDGCFYLVCGNDAGVSATLAQSDTSPIREPRCGAIARFSPEGRPLDVLADGFRNPYDLDFNAAGSLLTVDSDNERDHHLPWYAPTRLFDVAQGRGHGWLFTGIRRSWNQPESYFDNVPRVAEIGRGSPTGLVVYRHRQFPEHYRGAVLSACWTLGRVYCLPLESRGASYASDPEIFIETIGSVGFAPCDLAVGPQGDLFIAVGGRRTRGSVFRVRYGDAASRPANDLSAVLDADQPLAAWSRAQWMPVARRIGPEPFREALLDGDGAAAEIRAIETLVEMFDGVPLELAIGVESRKPAPEVLARLAWALSRRPLAIDGRRFLAGLTQNDSPAVARAAWEALSFAPPSDEADPRFAEIWPRALQSPDRRVRAAAIVAGGGACNREFREYLGRAAKPGGELAPLERLAGLEASYLVRALSPELPNDAYWDVCVALFDAAATAAARLDAIRLVHLGLGDIEVDGADADAFIAYAAPRTADLPAAAREKLERWLARALAPAGDDPELNRELARLAAVFELKDPGALAAVAAHWTGTSSPQEDVHYLIVAARLAAPRSADATRQTAAALAALSRKLSARGETPGGNWELRVGETFDELCRRDPALPQSLLDDPGFGAAAHAMFVARLPTADIRQRAIERMLQRAAKSDERATPELIKLVSELASEPARDWLREKADDVGLADPVALALAAHPVAEDRPRFVAALASVQPAVCEAAAHALRQLPGAAAPADLAAAIEALRRAANDPNQAGLARAADALLNVWTAPASPDASGESAREKFDAKAAHARWWAWFAETYPAEAEALAKRAIVGGPAWNARLAAIDWSGGDAARGKVVFERRSCNRCHLGARQLGPDLRGAITRMARDDLFGAIIDPNREISPTFASTMFITAGGQIYQGVIAYESPEGILIQTGPDTTVRITDTNGLVRAPSRMSLMPEGLLNGASDADLADLNAFLQTLAKPASKKTP